MAVTAVASWVVLALVRACWLYASRTDLEAAPQPERRTITRKQYEMAVGRISSSRDELSASVCALICLREWDLTVEDA